MSLSVEVRWNERIKSRESEEIAAQIAEESTETCAQSSESEEAAGPLSRYQNEWRMGSDQGYGKGWSHGFHMGRCQSLMRDIPQERGILWDLKVMFVRANGLPYTAMNEGIEGSLRDMVREVIVVNPADPLVQIAAETRPDLVLVLDAIGQSLPGDVVQAIRAHGIRTAIWLPDDPYHSDQSTGSSRILIMSSH